MSGVLNLLLAGAASAIKDAYFNLTTLLLNTSSTNGAQNNTFLDSSSNNFTITRNGNTTQGTFTPFSQTGWSNNFNGTTDYLSLAASTDWQWPSTSWTVEMWVYNITNTNYTGRTAPIQIQNGSATTDINDWSFGTDGNGKASFYYWIGSGPESVVGSTTIPLNTWTHIAATYDGTSAIKVYVNGVLDATGSKTGTPVTSTKNLIIGAGNGAYYNGYISNLRRVVGSVVYTSNFTPSTTPLTAITNTQILTCQSNRFIDNSVNAYPLTTGGTPSVQAFSPFLPTAAYDAAVVGGSGYFDGSGDYLVTPSNAAVSSTLLASDFTIECWLYLTTYPGGGAPIWTNSTSNSDGFSSVYVTSSGTIAIGKVGVNEVASTATVVRNAWNHFATVRSGSTVYLYLNGAQIVSGTASTYLDTSSAKPLQIAQSNQSTPSALTGYISGYRAVSSALYTGSTYTIPTSVPTAISGTSLLLNFTNAGIFDSAAKNVLETVGNAQVSTTQAKWGTTSMAFDGTGDYVYLPSNQLLAVGSSGDFTIETWIYPTTGSVRRTLLFIGSTGATDLNLFIEITAANVLRFLLRNTAVSDYLDISSTTTVSLNTWSHIAVVVSGTTGTIYLNGTSVASGSFSTTRSGAYTTGAVGALLSGGATHYFVGYMDDFRVTKYARYTTTFTPATAAFPLQ